MTKPIRAAIIVGSCFLVPSFLLAEVAVDAVPGSPPRPIVFAQITDSPDPIGLAWQLFRPAAPRVLNAEGYERGDGPRDLTSLPDGRPVAVWAYNTGADHDVALSAWTGSSWGQTEFVTVGLEDDLDPRLFVEADGTHGFEHAERSE